MKYAGLAILRNQTDCLKIGIIGIFNRLQALKTNPVNDLLFLYSVFSHSSTCNSRILYVTYVINLDDFVT